MQNVLRELRHTHQGGGIRCVLFGSIRIDTLGASLFVLGVLLGSASWWLILANVAGSLRGHMNRDWMQTLNRLSGSLVLLFGLVVLVVSLRKAIAA